MDNNKNREIIKDFDFEYTILEITDLLKTISASIGSPELEIYDTSGRENHEAKNQLSSCIGIAIDKLEDYGDQFFLNYVINNG